MAKIHTHYDNLKVSRMAPQEVIRAAYKALSQKYHPDKNPGDEKAARIMAILNSAYETLSDPQRRKEHDEWIGSEEWEIEWLESTRHEEGQRADKARHDSTWHPEHAHHPQPPAGRRRRRDWRLWAGVLACLTLGWVGGVTMVAEPQVVSSMLSGAWGGKVGGINANAAPTDPPPKRDGEVRDGWATVRLSDARNVKPSPIRVAALSQVVLPSAGAECDSETQTLVAPNGEPWPSRSGYMEGFPVSNRGEDMQLTLDNSSNGSAVFIKVYDLERHSNVRYAYVQAHDKLLVDKLATGKYEIRYQNLDIGANPGACAAANSRTASAAPSTVNN